MNNLQYDYSTKLFKPGKIVQVGQMYQTNSSPVGSRVGTQERILLVKNEPQVLAVKTEPKPEPADTYSLADLDSITDLLPIQTGNQITQLFPALTSF